MQAAVAYCNTVTTTDTARPRTVSVELAEQLKLVRADKTGTSLARFPDFMVVGPQRTGTTWLHANLREHPEVFFSEPKELFFFNRLVERDHLKFTSDRLDYYLRFFSDSPQHWIYKQARALVRHRRLYLPRVRGEATASYAALPEEVIAEITTLNPSIRIIMMLRDPVERAWSHARKDLVRNPGRSMLDVSDQQWQEFFAAPYQLACARYQQNLERWQDYLQPGNALVLPYDDVSLRPSELLLETMRFLGVTDDARYVGDLAEQRVNPAGDSSMPDHHREFLEDLLSLEIVDYHTLVDSSASSLR